MSSPVECPGAQNCALCSGISFRIFCHILLVIYSTGLSSIIIMISSYAFLGLGLETGTAEWGAMFVNANKLMFSHPELLVYPGLCILFAAAGFNLFGEALRDLCAPKEGS